jgi:hypothetical protein
MPSHFITCLECNRLFKSITSHVYVVHGLTRVEYTQKHKLPLGYKMTSEVTRQKKRQAQLASGYMPEKHVMTLLEIEKSVLHFKEFTAGRPSSELHKVAAQKSFVKAVEAWVEKGRTTVACVGCQEEFSVQRSRIKKGQKYCSSKCYHERRIR